MRAVCIGLAIALISLAPASATEASGWFNDAVRFDAAGDATAAFGSYRRAAEAGLPEAEFNVAVMLDSGRGVAQDVAAAAVWYARAASRGNPRAAYNLGQLYEAGEGVPRNTDLARAWFASSNLPAARARAVALRNAPGEGAAALTPPQLVAPATGVAIHADAGIELVWTGQTQPDPVRFFVEVRALEESGSREVFSGSTETSSLFAALPVPGGDYAWRVLTVGRRSSRYAASEWSRFRVAVP